MTRAVESARLHPLRVSDVLATSGLTMLAIADEDVWTLCPHCGTRQSLAECSVEAGRNQHEISTYVCRTGCTVLAFTAPAASQTRRGSATRRPGTWTFQVGEYLVATASPDGLQFASPVTVPATPASLLDPALPEPEVFEVSPAVVTSVVDTLPTVAELEATVADVLPSPEELAEPTVHPLAAHQPGEPDSPAAEPV